MRAILVQLLGKGDESPVIPSGFHFDNIHYGLMLGGYKNSDFLVFVMCGVG